MVREFGLAQFGDERLSERLQTIAGAVVRQPEKSLPQQSGNAAARKATYRFLGSERATPEQILAPHVAATVARCRERKRVLVAHDTTKFAFVGREQLGYLSGTMRGFIAHFALAIAFEENREPLGVLHVEPIVRDGEPKRAREPSAEIQRTSRCAGIVLRPRAIYCSARSMRSTCTIARPTIILCWQRWSGEFSNSWCARAKTEAPEKAC